VRILRKSPVLLLVLALSSCSLFRSRVEPYPAGVIFPLTEAGKLTFEGDINGALAQGEEGQLYFSTDKGHLYCLEGSPPKIAWDAANAAAFGSPPDLAPDRIFVWDFDNVVWSFDRTGKPGWKTKVVDKITSPISHDSDRLFVGTEAGDLIALSQATGEELWRFRTGAAVSAAAVFYADAIVLGSRDGSVYLVSPKGVRRSAIDLGSPVSVTPLVDGHRLYVGTEDFGFSCYDLKSKKRRWKIMAAGRILAPPRADEERVYLQASNSVLYALHKSGGEILWWWAAPSRSPYGLGFDGDKVLVTSRSPLLFALDKKTGKAAGQYEAGTEIRSNPVWAVPNLLFALFDPAAGQGVVSWLEKEVQVKVSSSPSSPQPPGTEVVFTASASGFYRPEFEFLLRRGEEKTVVQKASDKKSWVWYPEKEGSYSVSVKVTDEKQAKEADIPFEVAVKNQKDEKKKDDKGEKR
jgi:outer membrane protein assembly factor BamB